MTIYSPFEGAGFNSPSPASLMNLIKRQVAGVPDDLRYFGGNPPAQNSSESPWPEAHFVQIGEPKEVLPGFFLFATRSATPGTMEMSEISLVMKTSKGGVLFVGCSHPGIEKNSGSGGEAHAANLFRVRRLPSSRHARRPGDRDGNAIARQVED